MRMQAVILAVYLALCAYCLVGHSSADQLPPNIVFLLTDDQDVASIEHMPRLKRLMRDEGMEFRNCFVSSPLCGPSRATILRGQFSHNTKIYDNGDLNSDTYLSGGLKKLVADGLEGSTIATHLRGAGYETFLIGKYINGYHDGKASHIPAGWDHWWGMTKPNYFGPHFSQDGKLLKTPASTYQTDFISDVSQDLIVGRNKNKPFFIYIAPFAPHHNSLPAPRHANLFSDKRAPRNLAFNPSSAVQQQKPSWIKHMSPLNTDQLNFIDNLYRNRLRALQSVDEMLENITMLLQREGIAHNTYIFYMADNGEHLGEFRLPPGKRQAYDTDFRVPFLVRGPGIEGGTKVTEVVMSVDLVPTWVELGGGELPTAYSVDGKSITPLLFGNMAPQPKVNKFRSAALAEMYGGSSTMGLGGRSRYRGKPNFKNNQFWSNTYQAVRVINGSGWATNADWLYAEWCTGEEEFYDVSADSHQINNHIHTTSPTHLDRLSALTESLGDCSGVSCSDVEVVKRAGKPGVAGHLKRKLRCFNPPDLRDPQDTCMASRHRANPHCK